ncbi:lysophospholipid acyltransferase family protein [Chthonobacter rhizosphaerae]|uniref:lysophospholipid acyltransferase family protein n=1 Tax=Chthonobacter rhizosphaerae TaxID=2735553 RepID=UPI0015EF4BA5|nr:lysophospholipid acyltransferase family protein [Chthonobacter rhizosphaerae]
MVIRSLVFYTLFYLGTFTALVLGTPFVLPFGQKAVMAVARAWGASVMAVHRAVLGVRHEVIGLQNIPDGPCIIAAKHQSAWETMALLPFVPNFAFILKRELIWIPLFGWWAAVAGMIPVDRGRGAQALAGMTEAAKTAMANGRQIIIFPEGTRREAGAEPRYKFGVAHLYRDLGVPIVPVALNSGVVWARRAPWQRPGTITMEFLPPIPPGLDPREAFERLQATIETESDRLLVKAADEGMRLPPAAAARVEALRAAGAVPAA